MHLVDDASRQLSAGPAAVGPLRLVEHVKLRRLVHALRLTRRSWVGKDRPGVVVEHETVSGVGSDVDGGAPPAVVVALHVVEPSVGEQPDGRRDRSPDLEGVHSTSMPCRRRRCRGWRRPASHPAARQFCCSCNALDTGGVNPNPERARRRYTSPLREEAARRTRETIRDAAARLFVRDGYVSTTVKNIADEAGVAVRTVFTAFPGGKAEIFREALDHAVTGDGDPRAVAAADSEPSHVSGAVSHVDLVVEQVVRYGTAMLERAGGCS